MIYTKRVVIVFVSVLILESVLLSIYNRVNNTSLFSVSWSGPSLPYVCLAMNNLKFTTECLEQQSALVGSIKVKFHAPRMPALEAQYPQLCPGGHNIPTTCRARHRVAIIVPYRDREEHLRALLHNLHPMLMRQQLDYRIYIVEQVANQTFNRAKLMNVGYTVALQQYDWQCFVFHDIDLYPENDRNIYSCPSQPRHMSVAVDKFKYKLPYSTLFGGVTALNKEHMELVNGFSNSFWGWGGEDDEMFTRLTVKNLTISRYSANIARYRMQKHEQERDNPVNECRFKLMKAVRRRMEHDGLSTLNYTMISVEARKLYMHLKVDLYEADARKRLSEEKTVKPSGSMFKTLHIVGATAVILVIINSVFLSIYLDKRDVVQPINVALTTKTDTGEKKRQALEIMVSLNNTHSKNNPRTHDIILRPLPETNCSSIATNLCRSPEARTDTGTLRKLFLTDLQDLRLPRCAIPKTDRACTFRITQVERNYTSRQFGKNSSAYIQEATGLCEDGHYAPANCTANSKVAIIVPFRNRMDNLKGLLYHLHSLLQQQKLEYQIYVVEQVQKQTFNKAKLFNIGYLVAQRQLDWDCYIFHDVDLYPLFDYIDYSCTDQPRVLLSGVEGWDGGSLWYKNFFGGVVQLTRRHMEAVNGFSNNYWGWGGEDDDMGVRLAKRGFEIDKLSNKSGIFKNERPVRQGREDGNLQNKWNGKLLAYARKNPTYERDGLSTVKARIVSVRAMSNYTLALADLLEFETKRERELFLSIMDLKAVLSRKLFTMVMTRYRKAAEAMKIEKFKNNRLPRSQEQLPFWV